MRLFISIELPEEVKNYLIELQKKIKFAKVKDVDKNNMHLTLKFLGEVSENKIEELKNKLSQIKFESFKAKISDIGFFPSETYIKVVWVGVKPEQKIIDLQQSIEKILLDMFPADNKFKPHLTIGRIKFIKNKKDFKDSVQNIKVKEMDFIVDKFVLVKSTLKEEGPVHEIIKEYTPKLL